MIWILSRYQVRDTILGWKGLMTLLELGVDHLNHLQRWMLIQDFQLNNVRSWVSNHFQYYTAIVFFAQICYGWLNDILEQKVTLNLKKMAHKINKNVLHRTCMKWNLSITGYWNVKLWWRLWYCGWCLRQTLNTRIVRRTVPIWCLPKSLGNADMYNRLVIYYNTTRMK